MSTAADQGCLCLAGSRVVVAHASSQQRQPKKDFSDILFDFIYPESVLEKGNLYGWRWKAMMVCMYLLVGGCLLSLLWALAFL